MDGCDVMWSGEGRGVRDDVCMSGWWYGVVCPDLLWIVVPLIARNHHCPPIRERPKAADGPNSADREQD